MYFSPFCTFQHSRIMCIKGLDEKFYEIQFVSCAFSVASWLSFRCNGCNVGMNGNPPTLKSPVFIYKVLYFLNYSLHVPSIHLSHLFICLFSFLSFFLSSFFLLFCYNLINSVVLLFENVGVLLLGNLIFTEVELVTV